MGPVEAWDISGSGEAATLLYNCVFEKCDLNRGTIGVATGFLRSLLAGSKKKWMWRLGASDLTGAEHKRDQQPGY
jgi:hypothetical protein